MWNQHQNGNAVIWPVVPEIVMMTISGTGICDNVVKATKFPFQWTLLERNCNVYSACMKEPFWG